MAIAFIGTLRGRVPSGTLAHISACDLTSLRIISIVVFGALLTAGCTKNQDTEFSDRCDAVAATMVAVMLEETKTWATDVEKWSRQHQPEIRALFIDSCRQDGWPESTQRCFADLSIPRDLGKEVACFEALPKPAREAYEARAKAMKARQRTDLGQ
jgi:hypothetical protein